MEKVNLNFHGYSNIFRTILWILSVISWLLLLIIGWIGFISFNEENIIWTINTTPFQFLPSNNKLIHALKYYVPFQMTQEFIYITFIILMILLTAGFVVYILYATWLKDNSNVGVFNGMMGPVSKFNFIPFVCASALFFIGISYNNSDYKEELIISSVCFSFVGFICLSSIHSTAKLNSPWYINCIIKKGAFSCLITIFLYNLLNNIIKIGIVAELNRVEKMDAYETTKWILNYDESAIMDFMKNCRIAIPLTMGIVSLSMAFVLKDVCICIMNFLIFLGCTITYYDLEDDDLKKRFVTSGEAVIDIIFLILSILVIIPMVILYKKKLLTE